LTGYKHKILVYGYGNPGRQDDGLGIRLAEEIEKWCSDNHLTQVSIDSNYQLNLEDAANIALYDMVIFADASKENIPDYRLDILLPSEKSEFSLHAVSPGFVLYLCGQLFNRKPLAYLLHIRGFEWELTEGLTDKANENLQKAFHHIKKLIFDYLNCNSN
jgi:hydrogenase maturation protease